MFETDVTLEATHKRMADIFHYFLNPLPHSSLADLAKKKIQKSYCTTLNKKNVWMLNQV